jgi:DNA-binding transcriptional regulator YhcF (GntR family)
VLPNTVLKAYRELEVKDLISGKPGQGTFIQTSVSQVALPELTGLRLQCGPVRRTTSLRTAYA